MGVVGGGGGGEGEQLADNEGDDDSRTLIIKPIFLRKDVLECFQWRIRNLPYPEHNYILEVDSEKQEIVIKTTIKKYFKRFDVPDLKRANIKLSKEALSFKHANNTLIVSVPLLSLSTSSQR
jgi:hypothetical protein